MMTVRVRLAAVASLAAMTVACVGLSPREDPTVFLVLAPGAATVPMPPIARQDLRVGVGPVTLPRYLDRPQWVTRVGATEVTINEYARWAAPLASLVAETVAENLDRYLALGDAVVFPWRLSDAPHYGVRLHLLHFEATAGDSARLVGSWEILDRAGAAVAPGQQVSLSVAAPPDPVTGAAALSELLGLLSADIAGALRSLPGEGQEEQGGQEGR